MAEPEEDIEEAVVSESGRMESKKSEAVIFPPDPRKSTSKDWISVSDELAYQYRENLSQQIRKFIGSRGHLARWISRFLLD